MTCRRFKHLRALFLFALGVVSNFGNATHFAITPIYIPEAEQVVPMGINDAGDIVGYYYKGGTIDVNYGFLLTGGELKIFQYPGAQFTDVRDINNDGEIVGSYYRMDTGWQSFMMTGEQFITMPEIPVGRGFSFADGIPTFGLPGTPFDMNSHGDRVGRGPSSGFLHKGGSTQLVHGTEAIFGINNHGQMVGASYEHGTLGVFIQPIPEPSTLALLGASTILFLAWRGREI